MKQYTPGPWTLVGTTTIANAEQTMGIANVCAYSVEPSEANANANLIAAAPDLLESIQALLAVANVRIDDPRIVQFDACRAAIAKATGVAA